MLVEFFVVFAAAYGTSVLYHLLAYKDLSRADLYIPLSFFLSAFYFLVCLIDNQYDLFGDKWRKDGISRALGAIALAFAFFLSFVFIFDLDVYFSRGTFLSQLVLVSASIAITRVILVQRLERATQSGGLQGRGIIVISLVADSALGDYASKLCTASDKIVNSYALDVSHFRSEKSRGHAIADIPSGSKATSRRAIHGARCLHSG